MSKAIAMLYSLLFTLYSIFVNHLGHKGPSLEARTLLMAAAKAELRIE